MYTNLKVSAQNYLFQTGRDRVRRGAGTQVYPLNTEEKEDELKNRIEEEKVDDDVEEEMEDLFSNKFPSAHTIASVLRSIADAADLYRS